MHATTIKLADDRATPLLPRTRTRATGFADTDEAEDKAREFLAGASTATELVGRQVCMLVMARMADENAVANSTRSFYQLGLTSHGSYARYGRQAGLPWAGEVLGLLDELAIERLPEHLTQPLRDRRDQAERDRVEREQRQVRYEQLLAAVPDMTAEDRAAALQQVEHELDVAAWSPAYRRVAQAVQAAAAAEAESTTPNGEDGDGDGEPPATPVDNPGANDNQTPA